MEQAEVGHNWVRYHVYPPSPLASEAEAATFRSKCSEVLDAFLCGYIWHRDGLQLRTASTRP